MPTKKTAAAPAKRSKKTGKNGRSIIPCDSVTFNTRGQILSIKMPYGQECEVTVNVNCAHGNPCRSRLACRWNGQSYDCD